MGKPVKIHKKKSFMFTTRHYSLMSIIGILIGVFCICVAVTLIVNSYNNAGNVSRSFGAIGMFSALLNIVGLFCGTTSLNERDIYISAAIVAISLNGIMLLAWVLMIILSIFV